MDAFIDVSEEGDDAPIYRNRIIVLYGALFDIAMEMKEESPHLFDIFLDQEFKIRFYINCNDYFYYASADAEEVEPYEIPELYFIVRHLGFDGVNAWAARKRGILPLPIYQDENFKKCYEIIPYMVDHFHYYLERHPNFVRIEEKK